MDVPCTQPTEAVTLLEFKHDDFRAEIKEEAEKKRNHDERVKEDQHASAFKINLPCR